MRAVAPFRRFASAAGKPSFIQQALFDAPSQTPLNEEYPGVPALSNKAAAPSAAQVTKLPNGLTVASQDQHGATASLGVYVKAGSRYEAVPGTSHVLEQIAFGTTQKRSTLKVQRDVEDLGAVVAAKTGREAFVYSGEVLRDGADELAAIIGEVVTQPKLWPWEVKEQRDGALAALVAAQAADPVTTIVESVHSAAFGADSALGHGLYANPEDLSDVDSDVVRSFLGGAVAGGNIVLTGVNVEHSALVDAADKYLSTLPSGASTTAPKSLYVGGETLIRSHKTGTAHVALAFAAPGLNDPKVHALGGLQALLGSTGPHGGAAGAVRLGFTKQSRIARSVHTEAHSFIQSLAAFAFPYSDSGLLGIVGSAADHEAGRLLDVAAGFLKDAAGVGATPAELDRAKKAYKLAYLAGVESRTGARDDIGASLLLTGKLASVAETLKAIDAVTAADVAAVAKGALASAPSVAAIGSLTNLPRYDAVASLLK